MLQDWNTDKIIGAGLVIALFMVIICNLLLAIFAGMNPTSDLPVTIVTGLAGYMGRSLLEKKDKNLMNDDIIRKDDWK